MSLIAQLTELVGFHSSYVDHFGNKISPCIEAQKELLLSMGYQLDDIPLQNSIKGLQEKKWTQALEPTYFISKDNTDNFISISLPVTSIESIKITLEIEDEISQTFEQRLETLVIEEEKALSNTLYKRYKLALPNVKEGYHKLTLNYGNNIYQSDLVAVPKQCYSLKDAGADKVWGYAVQLYSLKSQTNWGLGDFSDLKELTKSAANGGASVVGLNPLHALYYNNAAHISPYSPSSRSFLNVLYIDVTSIDNFNDCAEAKKRTEQQDFIDQISHLRQQKLIDYSHTAYLKKEILSLLFNDFCEHKDNTTYAEFEEYVNEQGQDLKLYATYEALYEYFTKNFPDTYHWKQWSREYQSPDTQAVYDYQKDNEKQILFYCFIQWIAHKQLNAVNDIAKDSGMAVGLYLDLAVGCDGGGFDVWSQQALYLTGASVGAPPDAMNNLGQDWGLTPINPLKLREQSYKALIKALRSSMQYAGAIRIDHILGLMRQYWVAPGMKASEGIYISFPFDEILSIIALESQRNKCIVIGEDLGTVPEGFSEHMQSYGLLSYKILFFERWWETGLFKRPEIYSDKAMVTASTHDLPTVKGWWMGRDLEWRQKLHLYPNEELGIQDRSNRVLDRDKLIAALKDYNVLEESQQPPMKPAQMNRALSTAVYKYLGNTPSPIHLIPIEDALEVIEQVNIPGTIDEHPNWRQKLPITIDEIWKDNGVKSLTTIMNAVRPK